MNESAQPSAEEILELIPDAVLICDSENRILQWTGSAEEIFGYTAEEAIGRQASFLQHPHFRGRTGDGIAMDAIRAGVYSGDVPAIRKDGREILIHVTGKTVFGENGNVRFVIGLNKDITGRETAKRAQLQLQAILDGVTDGVLVWERSGRYLYANEVGARMSGYNSIAEMVTTPSSEVIQRFEIFDENGDPFPVERLPGRLALSGVADAPPVVMQYRLRGEEEMRWSIVSSRPIFDERGEVEFAVTIFRDFTERKRNELERENLLRQVRRQERHASFLDEATRLLTSSLDYRLTLERVARLAVEKLEGWAAVSLKDEEGRLSLLAVEHTDPSKIPLVRELRALYPPDPEKSTEYAVLRTGMRSFIPSISEEMINQRAVDDRHRELLGELGLKAFICVPIRTRKEVIGVIDFASSERAYDDADLRLAEELSKRASLAIENALLFKQSQEAIQVRDEFLSIASHELKTPLTALKLHVQNFERLLKVGGAEDGRAFMQRTSGVLSRQITRLNSLVDDLLDVSRISAGKLSLNTEDFDLRELLQETYERYQVQAAVVDCVIRLEVSGDLNVRWDRIRIEQVVVNLLTNALKYAPRCTIDLRAERLADRIRISVADRGPGIALPDQAKIFDRFERVRMDRHVGGLGLGLFISRQVVEAHGGKIWVESAPGQGAAFFVELPTE